MLTNKVLSVLVNNKDLDFLLGAASHEREDESEVSVDIPGCKSSKIEPSHYIPYLQRLADPPLLLVNISTVAVHVDDFILVPDIGPQIF